MMDDQPAAEVLPLEYAPPGEAWYSGVTRYQWLVLIIASAGWVFDAFEGQIYNITRQDLLKEFLHDPARQKYWGDLFIGSFLLGGTLGGIGFGSLADRIGQIGRASWRESGEIS